MFFNQVQREPQGTALGLKGLACFLGTPRGKGSPKVPGQPLGPNHLLHDGPNEAAAQNDGGHHQQVEVDQVEILSGGGRGWGSRGPPAHIRAFFIPTSPCSVLSTGTVPTL